ncbi:MAG: hypothetical protein BWX69_03268 [Planctomycetes bacterium ADurb.Bin069]|nr:MAG: hypothetical protein BWX69_03268 [Planctomycetes bacterium ADurb.Bin069]
MAGPASVLVLVAPEPFQGGAHGVLGFYAAVGRVPGDARFIRRSIRARRVAADADRIVDAGRDDVGVADLNVGHVLKTRARGDVGRDLVDLPFDDNGILEILVRGARDEVAALDVAFARGVVDRRLVRYLRRRAYDERLVLGLFLFHASDDVQQEDDDDEVKQRGGAPEGHVPEVLNDGLNRVLRTLILVLGGVVFLAAGPRAGGRRPGSGEGALDLVPGRIDAVGGEEPALGEIAVERQARILVAQAVDVLERLLEGVLGHPALLADESCERQFLGRNHHRLLRRERRTGVPPDGFGTGSFTREDGMIACREPRHATVTLLRLLYPSRAARPVISGQGGRAHSRAFLLGLGCVKRHPGRDASGPEVLPPCRRRGRGRRGGDRAAVERLRRRRLPCCFSRSLP